jgi:hypothetical protein
MPNGATRRVASWYWVGKILWMLGGHLAHLYRLCGLCPQLLVRYPRASTPVLIVGVGSKLVARRGKLLTPLLQLF